MVGACVLMVRVFVESRDFQRSGTFVSILRNHLSTEVHEAANGCKATISAS